MSYESMYMYVHTGKVFLAHWEAIEHRNTQAVCVPNIKKFLCWHYVGRKKCRKCSNNTIHSQCMSSSVTCTYSHTCIYVHLHVYVHTCTVHTYVPLWNRLESPVWVPCREFYLPQKTYGYLSPAVPFSHCLWTSGGNGWSYVITMKINYNYILT